MISVNVTNLTEQQKKWLLKRATLQGTSMAGVVKQLITQAMDKELQQQKGAIYERD